MRAVKRAAAILTVLGAMTGAANAQDWPAKQVTFIVPFSAGGTTDLFGRLLAVTSISLNITLAWTQVKAGRLHALAVTSTERSAIAPDVPTMAETIPGFEATSWHGVFAPAGTPKAIVDAMAAETKRILELPDVKEKLAEIGAVASPMTPEDFTKLIDGERTKWPRS